MEIDGAPVTLGRRERVVLVVLVLHAGEFVSADRLAAVLWPEELPASWNKVIQGCIVRIRKLLGRGVVETATFGYRLTVRRDEVDLYRFEGLVAWARQLDAENDADRVAYVLGEAISLWRGATIAELDDAVRLVGERERLVDLRRVAREEHVQARLRCGHHHDVTVEAQELVATAPWRERGWSLLALAQYRSARQADALRTLHQARRFLADEFGLEPGPELVDLEQRILRHDPSLLRPPRSDGSVGALDVGVCPYRGLLPYEIDDEEFFFGRDALIGVALDRLGDVGTLVVAGPSGSGKSSLVRAGIAGSLRRAGHDVRVITPGKAPLDAFRRATESPVRSGTVLIIDQLEEIFSQANPAEVLLFVQQLAEWSAADQLILALRSDYLAHVGSHRPLAEIVERSLLLLGPLATEDLRAAIEGPAAACGLRIEPGLVELLLRDADDEPGSLPLMSHALRATWHNREGQSLTIAGYQQTGGLRNAIAQSAEQVYVELGDERQHSLMKSLMLRLFVRSTRGDPVRTPMSRSLVDEDEDRAHLVARMITARLLVADQQGVSVAHESLATAWPRLHEWLDDDVDNERRLHHLAASTAAWVEMGRPHSELYRGARLDAVAGWRTERAADLAADECEFLDASIERETDEREAVSRELAIRTAANRRLRVAVVAIGCLLAVSLVVGVAFVVQTGRARTGRQQARAAAVQAQRGQLVATAQSTQTTNRDVAALLSIEANRLAPGPASRSALFGQFTADPGFVGYTRLANLTQGLSGAVALDADRILVADDTGTVRIVNAVGGYEPGEQFPPQTAAGAGILAMSESGAVLAQLIARETARRAWCCTTSDCAR